MLTPLVHKRGSLYSLEERELLTIVRSRYSYLLLIGRTFLLELFCKIKLLRKRDLLLFFYRSLCLLDSCQITGQSYALTAVCMLTSYPFCMPLKNKLAEEIVTAWRNHITFLFLVCRKLLMDNGTEFKNDLFLRVTEQLGAERKIYSPPYRPQSNGRIEGFHKFFKSCLAKHISRHREWDDVVPLAIAS